MQWAGSQRNLQAENETNVEVQTKLKDVIARTEKPLIAGAIGYGKIASLLRTSGRNVWCTGTVKAMVMVRPLAKPSSIRLPNFSADGNRL